MCFVVMFVGCVDDLNILLLRHMDTVVVDHCYNQVPGGFLSVTDKKGN